jgi:hypothetical protein
MADKKVTELPAAIAVQGSNLLLVIEDPAGTPVSKKATVDQLMTSPAITGIPTCPTSPANNFTSQIASTLYVQNAVDLAVGLVEAELTAYAPLDAPAFTGVPTGPTPAPGTNTTQLATTAYVRQALGGSQVVSLTGVQNDLALTNGVRLVRCTNATKLTISGMTAGYDGQVVTVMSIGSGEVHFLHGDGGSSAANRFICVATSTTTPLAPNIGRATFIYDALTPCWRITGHDQGAPIPYNAVLTNGVVGLTAPNIGSGTITASYLLWGRVLDLFIEIHFAANTTFGDNYWKITVPATLNGTSPVGTGFITTATVNNHPVIGTVPFDGIVVVLTSSEKNVGGANIVPPSLVSPAGLGAGDVLRLALASYPIA